MAIIFTCAPKLWFTPNAFSIEIPLGPRKLICIFIISVIDIDARGIVFVCIYSTNLNKLWLQALESISL